MITKVAWGQKVSREFVNKVVSISNSFGWPDMGPSYLMSCMAFESAETFSPAIRNAAGSGAIGLIQFMPNTAEGLGTSPDELVCMTAEGQLTYVAKYFAPYAHKIRTLSDMYMAILLPKYVGKPEDAVLFSHGIAYRQNAGLDANTDGQITKAEAAAFVQRKLDKGLLPENVLMGEWS